MRIASNMLFSEIFNDRAQCYCLAVVVLFKDFCIYQEGRFREREKQKENKKIPSEVRQQGIEPALELYVAITDGNWSQRATPPALAQLFKPLLKTPEAYIRAPVSFLNTPHLIYLFPDAPGNEEEHFTSTWAPASDMEEQDRTA